jgi:hypothetical protein
MVALASFAGAFQSVFVGDYSLTSPLTKIYSERTEGIKCTDVQPVTFIPSLGINVPSGVHVVRFSVKFYGDDDLIYQLARGVPVAGSPNDAVVSKAFYTFCLVFPIATLKRSYVFTNVYTETPLEVAYGKFNTEDPITFVGQNTNPNVQMLYKNTLANCKTYLGSRSPF